MTFYNNFFPVSLYVIPAPLYVIPALLYVIPALLYVIPGLTRNLVSNHLSGYKIPGQARNDAFSTECSCYSLRSAVELSMSSSICS